MFSVPVIFASLPLQACSKRKARPVFGCNMSKPLTHCSLKPLGDFSAPPWSTFTVFLTSECPFDRVAPRLRRCNLLIPDSDGSWCIALPHPTHSFQRKQCDSLPVVGALTPWGQQICGFCGLRQVIILQSEVSTVISELEIPRFHGVIP